MSDKQKILRQRAEKISRRSIVKISHDNEFEVLDFVLNGEHYCIETSFVVEVHKHNNIVKIPTAPPFILGIYNRRGKITSILDLKVLLNINADIEVDKTCLIIVADGHKEFGFTADSLGMVRNIKKSSISKEMPTLSTLPVNYVLGIESNKVVVLNIKNILNDSSLLVNDKGV